MEKKLTFRYDREADILHINKGSPYAEQDSEEIGDGVTRLLRSELLELPVTADLRISQ